MRKDKRRIKKANEKIIKDKNRKNRVKDLEELEDMAFIKKTKIRGYNLMEEFMKKVKFHYSD